MLLQFELNSTAEIRENSENTDVENAVVNANDNETVSTQEEIKEEVADVKRLYDLLEECSTLTETFRLNLRNCLEIPRYPKDFYSICKLMALPIVFFLTSGWDIISDLLLR